MAENDPFSLGDSDDEKDTKKDQTTVPESDQLKKATAEAMSEEVGSKNQETCLLYTSDAADEMD